MPPLTVIDRSTAGVTPLESTTLGIVAPQRARIGTQLLAVIAGSPGMEFTAADEWTELERLDLDTALIVLLRRTVTDEEPSAYDFEVDSDAFSIGAIAVVRGLAAGDLVDSDADEFAAEVEIVAPAVNATTYSDAALAVFLVLDEVDLEPPEGDTLVAIIAIAEASMLVSMRLPESAGAIPARALAELDAPADAVAASFVVPVDPPARPVLIDTNGTPGAIGLVTRGI